MLVVGGTYKEICRFPQISELYGSGLRAVCAIADITNTSNQFFTYYAGDEETLESYAATYDFGYEYIRTNEIIEFDYLHNYAEPVIHHEPSEPLEETIGPIDDDAILRFGMVEGDAIVDGGRVVYDPQSPTFDPFHKNGSEADQLALVLSVSEGRTLTDHVNPREIVENLCTEVAEYDVVVLKCGPYGGFVGIEDEVKTIPVYPTQYVRNIGSGDIFSAIFAAYWAEQKEAPFEAAKRASLATAFYSSQASLPIPQSPQEAIDTDLSEVCPLESSDRPKIYLAGPFFTIGQFYLIEEFYHALQDLKVDVFSPFHDVGRVSSSVSSEEIAKRDLQGLDDSDLMIALLDDDDPGTYFEIGYAREKGIPVVAYQCNPDQSQNAMIEGTDCQIFGDVTSTIFNAIWTYYD